MKNSGNICLILVFLIIGYLIYDRLSNSQNKKIAVIQLQDLVYGYQGMKDATKTYTAKMDKWSAQTDSLENYLKELIQEIRLDSIKSDKNKLIKDQQIFMYKRQMFFDYKEKIENGAQAEDKKMTSGVVNQVQEHIKEFAKENGYDLIISNTEMQNVGYAKDAMDVTKELLEFANKKYNGEK